MNRRALSGIVLVAVCGGLLAGCGAGTTAGPADSANGVSGALPRAVAPGVAQNDRSAQSGGQGAQGGQVAPQVPGRQVVRSANIGLRVTDLGTAESGVRRIAAAAGGYAGQEDDEGAQASFTLQVPQGGLDGVLDQLSHLGTTTSRTEQAQDVTNQLVDVQSRLASQQASVNRVRTLMDRATSVGDIVSIEGELTKREADLESLEQQQAELAGQVAMSAVTVQLTKAAAPVVAAAPGPTGFVGGLASGWHAFVAALGVLLVVLGAVLPFAVVLGGLGALAWWLLRRRRSTTRVITASPGGEE